MLWRLAGEVRVTSPTMGLITRRKRRLLIAGVLLGMFGAAAALAQPIAIGELIASISAKRSVAVPIISLIVFLCLDAVLAAAQAFLVGHVGEGIVFDCRRELVGRLLGADVAEFNRRSQGDLLTRSVTDTALVKVALANSLAILFVEGFMVVGGAVLMLLVDPLLTALTIGCLTIASLLCINLARRVRIVAMRNREETGQFATELQRVLAALPTVKACRAEKLEKKRIEDAARRARLSGIKVGWLSAALTPTMNIGMQMSLVIVVGAGMGRVAIGAMPLSSLTTFIMLLFYLASPLVMFFMAIGQLQQARAAIRRVDELLIIEQESDSRKALQSPSVGSVEFAVQFEDVGFHYDDRPEMLRGVTFDVPLRGITAVVGRSGAGKTTLFQLIERFYRPRAGRVLLFGEDIALMDLAKLRRLVGYAQQDSVAMRGTIRENLLYADPSADQGNIDRVLDVTGLREVIETLPAGLRTELGDQGYGLSGGQRQRLCIARALLPRPAVLLLDEVTSQLDSESEQQLRGAIRRVSADCAVIVIAHRISTVMDAEQIIVLEDGRVRAVGKHNELLNSDELYSRLASTQFAAAN